jgi:hypothetical protein
VVLRNAVFQVDKSELKPISYLLAYAKYTAVSDERQEGMIASMINEFNLSIRRLQAEPLPILADTEEGPLKGSEKQGPEKVLKALSNAQTAMAKEALQDFIRSLERRLNRDIRRVGDYYQTLARETRQMIEKKTSSGGDMAKAQNKIEAIEAERKWKIQDLIAKYSLSIRLKQITIVRLETVAPVFWLMIKRRKGTRSFPLTFNPILKVLDNLPCEACSFPQKGYGVCDDHLHIVCGRCFQACPKCGKTCCSACHPEGCPKCGFFPA